MLMNALFEYLRGIDCQGVHLKTTSLNNNALFFFQKMGFKKLYSRRTSFYNKYGFKDTENLVLGKILT
jgi:ribosomal protein S18 acetylase RimI-like enzyme